MNDSGCSGWLIVAGICLAVGGGISSALKEYGRKRLEANKALQKQREDIEVQRSDLNHRKEEWQKQQEKDKATLELLAKEKSTGFPWLAEAYADFFHLDDMRVALELERKKHPALKAADALRELGGKKRKAEKLWRILKYQLTYYETLFPWLEEYKEEGLDLQIREILEGPSDTGMMEQEDPVSLFMTKAEFANLSTTQRNQLALDRYWSKKKTNWEVGRDYERFIGYFYEDDGWTVKYQGIQEGFADLGRDLIASRGSDVHIVQCKCWSAVKTIHEKHIFQLYGSVVAYRLDHPNETVLGVFVTSTTLSDIASRFADALGIKVRESTPLGKYPCIKCNISFRTSEKIYHLPFDQQYDQTVVTRNRGELYLSTVREAESLGFRRAFRWRGDAES